ncbi:MAG: iron ABC transporter permease [Deltaproteobacteria bacterium]|nr:iron ABC transporter permease [Deltaproteobacteria bacterium]
MTGPLRELGKPVYLLFIVAGAVLAFLSLYPTFFLFYGSIRSAPLGEPGHLTWANYLQVYSDPETYRLAANTLFFAAAASLLSVIFALVLAWITVRTNAPFQSFLELTAVVPNIMPSLLIAISWVLLLNPNNGILNEFSRILFGIAPFNIYGFPGLVFVEALVLTPLAYLIIAAALRGMDPAFEESARTLGSGEIGVATRITFPLIRPAILAAATLNFVRAAETFDTPAIIALPARIELFTTKIFREAIGSFPANHNLAAAYGVGLLALTLSFVYVYRKLTAQVERYATVTGKGFRPHRIDLRGWRYPIAILAFVLLFMMVILPFLTLVLVSIMPFYQPSWEVLQNATFRHYVNMLHDDRIYRAFQNSLFLAVAGATVCVFFAAIISYLTVKTKIAGRGILESLAFVPWAFPGAALAIGILWAYINFPIPVYATVWILMIAYVTRFLPYGLRSVSSTIVQIHADLEEASAACGAGWLATFRRILLPLMRPGMVAGWIILATFFIREFSCSIFLYSPGAEPLGPLLYFYYQEGTFGSMAGVGVLITLVSVIFVISSRGLAKATPVG